MWVLLVCLGAAGCAHQAPARAPLTGPAVIVIDSEADYVPHALDVARALRRAESPSRDGWLATGQAPEGSLTETLASMESAFFDVDLPAAARAAAAMLSAADEGSLPVRERGLWLRAVLRAAQIFDAVGDGEAADAALRRAAAIQPGFELSAVDYPPSLLERNARIGVPSAQAALRLPALPQGARVWVDGERQDQPEARVPVGAHVVRAEAPGHRSWQRVVRVTADVEVTPELEVDPGRLHALPSALRQRYIGTRGAVPIRLSLTRASDGWRCRLLIPGEEAITVHAPADEDGSAIAGRLWEERDAMRSEAASASTRRRRRRWIIAASVVAVGGGAAGAYVGLRPGSPGWRASGGLSQ